MNIDDRIRKLLNNKDLTTEEISKITGIKYGRWTTIRKKDGRSRSEEIQAISEIWPEYALWLTTGKTSNFKEQMNHDANEEISIEEVILETLKHTLNSDREITAEEITKIIIGRLKEDEEGTHDKEASAEKTG